MESLDGRDQFVVRDSIHLIRVLLYIPTRNVLTAQVCIGHLSEDIVISSYQECKVIFSLSIYNTSEYLFCIMDQSISFSSLTENSAQIPQWSLAKRL